MHILLDENIEEGVAQVLSGLRHTVAHVRQSEHRGKKDQELARVLANFDVFITLDLHRQEAEWAAVNHAIINSGTAIVRIKLPKKCDPLIATVRSLVAKMEEWIREVEAGNCLIVITQEGTKIRSRTRAEVLRMLERRHSSQTIGNIATPGNC